MFLQRLRQCLERLHHLLYLHLPVRFPVLLRAHQGRYCLLTYTTQSSYTRVVLPRVRCDRAALTGERKGLLSSIEGFKKGKLKKAETIDKSKPFLETKTSASGG